MATGLTDVLLRFFESEYFDVWMCVLYLTKYSDNPEISAYLCNKLSRFPRIDIENFLPQLCNVYLYSPIEPGGAVELFLAKQCGMSMHFALRLWWLLDAEVADNKPATSQRAKKMRETAESCAINQQIPGQRRPSIYDSEGEVDQMEVFRLSCEKQRRCTYWETQLQFVTELCNLSYMIRTLASREMRTQQLKAYLRRLNSQLWTSGRLCRRVYFPLGCHSDTPYQLLLCIKPHEAVVLNSRDRAPYLIILECIHSEGTCAEPSLSYLGGPDVEAKSLLSSLPKASSDAKAEAPHHPTDGRRHRAPTAPTSSPPSRKGSHPQPISPVSTPPSSAASTCQSTNPSSIVSCNTSPSSTAPEPASPRHALSLPCSPLTPARKILSLGVSPPCSPIPQLPSFWPQDFKVNECRLVAYGESWAKRKERIRKLSPNGHLKGWDIKSYIVKAGDDMRQEALAMQLIKTFHSIWTESGLPVFLRPYEIMAISNSTGFIETVPDAVSLDSLKKTLAPTTTLLQYFCHVYGPVDSIPFRVAQRNFTESLVGYSLVTYLLQVKDRHNGNILLTQKGHLVHIDFGFILASSPGGMNFESAPFKLPAEYVELMGGQDSDIFHYFKVLMLVAFMQCRKHMERVVTLVRMMLPGDSFSCFGGDGAQMVRDLEARFNLTMPEQDLVVWIRDLIDSSADNWRTRQYDNFQYMTNGILA